MAGSSPAMTRWVRRRRTSVFSAAGITAEFRIIAFRNVLVHGHAAVDDRLGWGVIERDLDTLRATLGRRLEPPSTDRRASGRLPRLLDRRQDPPPARRADEGPDLGRGHVLGRAAVDHPAGLVIGRVDHLETHRHGGVLAPAL